MALTIEISRTRQGLWAWWCRYCGLAGHGYEHRKDARNASDHRCPLR